MKPDELAARSRAIAADNDGAVLGVLVMAGDAGLRPGVELAELVGLPESTTRQALGRLVGRGLAKRDGRRRVYATLVGRSEVGVGMRGASLMPALEAAIACFPAEALHACVRLQLDVVVAPRHLAREHPADWPGCISVGPTKTGKTAIARFMCRVLGLDEARAIVKAFRHTRGSLIGRRAPDAASTTRYRVDRWPALDLPWVCIDEWDKATPDLRAAAGGLLLGDTADELEGARFEIRPAVYVTLNAGSEALAGLHEAWVRRSVVVDTTPLQALLSDIDRDINRLLETGEIAIPRLPLDRLQPPAAILPPDLRRLLRELLRAGLTDDGWDHTDPKPLAWMALARAAHDDVELEQAAAWVALDYLICSTTLRYTKSDYAARLEHQVVERLAVDASARRRQVSARDKRIDRGVERRRLGPCARASHI